MKIELEFHITEQIQNILNILKEYGGKPRFVGGMVRDAIIGATSSDIDLATSLQPNQVMEILNSKGVKCIDTGSKYGTVTALAGKQNVEITTLRVDTDCDGRHTNAIFTDDFEQDALRRDFTINAMSYCPFSGELYDYAGGYDDLTQAQVRFIGDPKKRIEEDHLRILRFFRFSDRFAKVLDKESLASCIEIRGLLTKLSKERVLMEFYKLMASPTSHKILQVMIDAKIMAEVMPNAVLDTALLEEINEASDDLLCKFAALLHKTQVKTLESLLKDMRFSIKAAGQIRDLVAFKQHYPDLLGKNAEELKMIFYPLWVDGIDMGPYVLIASAMQNNNFATVAEKISTIPPKFPITGDDLIAKGLGGKKLGAVLAQLKLAWIESEFALSKEELLGAL